MINIPLQTIANQSLNIVLNDNNYVIRLHACEDSIVTGSIIDRTALDSLGTSITAVDIIENNITIVTGMRAVCGTPLLPYSYLQGDGNFIFVTNNDEYPNWRLFGINQYLIYATYNEIKALQNG